MARVYRARLVDDPTAAPVVVKLMRAQIYEDEQGPAMFRDEARLAHQLVHPNIVRVTDYGEHGNELFMAMELVDGPSLAQLMRTWGKPLPPRTALLLAINLCDGLDAAHKAKDAQGRPLHLVHRDVSPQNILLTLSGELKLADFGIAKVAFGREAMTKTNFIKGKIGYMSPEQLLGKSLDHRSDQFAAAICIWEMLTGVRLFKEKTDAANIQKVVYGRAERPSAINTNLPGALDEVVLRALEKNADDRYEDMHDFARALRGALPRFPAGPEDGVEYTIAQITGRPPPPKNKLPFSPPQSGSDPGRPPAPWSVVGGNTPSKVPISPMVDSEGATAYREQGTPASRSGPPRDAAPGTGATVHIGPPGPAQTSGTAQNPPLSAAYNTAHGTAQNTAQSTGHTSNPPTGTADLGIGAPQTPGTGSGSGSSGMQRARGTGQTHLRTGQTALGTEIMAPPKMGFPVLRIGGILLVAGIVFLGGFVVGERNQPELCGSLSTEPKKIDNAYDKAVEAQRMLEGGSTVDAVERAKISLAHSATGRAHFVLARAAFIEFRNQDAFFHLMCTARLDPEGDEVRWALERIRRRD